MRWRTIARTALCALVLAAVGGSSATAANDRPAPPTDVRVPALAFDEHSITLAWEKPADHAGIVDYQVFVNGQLAGSANSTGLSFGSPDTRSSPTARRSARLRSSAAPTRPPSAG